MEIWIPITIAAAFLQNLRSALQKYLGTNYTLSTLGATSVRFIYAVPFAMLYIAILNRAFDKPLPIINETFLLYVLLVAISQIIGTAMLLYLFTKRNFAVSTAYSKTETIQAALFGTVILGDVIGILPTFAILVSVSGVLLISSARTQSPFKLLLRSWTKQDALIGISSGAAFAMAAVGVRGATLSLAPNDFVINAAYSLLATILVQSVIMTIYLYWKQPHELTRIMRAWPLAGAVGLSGMLASACWFSAMAIQNVAYVRALGQIELLFTFIASYFFFRESYNKVELLGITLVIGGILLLLVGR